MTRDLQGQGGGGSAHSCPRCGVFFGTYIAGDAAVALRCAECGYTVEPHSHSTAPLPAALDSGLRYWVDRMRPVEPASVPADPAERTLLSLQSRWAHAECSCEQVAAEAIAVIRQLTLDASAERARLSTQVAALSALAETILRPPPEIQEVYDLQMRLVPHCDELDRVLGSDDRCLLNSTLGAMHGMHLRIQKLESGQAPPMTMDPT